MKKKEIGSNNFGTHSDLIWLILNSALSSILSIPAGIITASIIGPFGIGIVKIFQTIVGYVNLLDFGLTKALQRKIPLSDFKTNKVDLKDSINVVFTYSLLSSVVGIFIIIFLYNLDNYLFDDFNGTIIVILFCTILSQRLVLFFGKIFSGDGYYKLNSQVNIALAVIKPLLTIILVYYFEIIGLLAGYVICDILYVLFVRINININPKFERDFSLFKNLNKIGLSVFSISALNKIFWSFEILLMPLFFTLENLGIYGYAIGLITLIKAIPSSINNYLFRNIALLSKIPRGQSSRNIHEKTKFYLNISHFINVLIIGNGFLFFVIVINNFLPDFVESIKILYVLSIGMMFFTIRILPSLFLNLKGDFKTLIILNSMMVLTSIIFFFINVVKNDLYIIAYSRFIVFTFFGLLSYYIFLKEKINSPLVIIKNITIKIMVVGMSIIAIIISKNIIEYNVLSNMNIIILESAKMILSMLNFSAITLISFSILLKKENFFEILLSIKNKLKTETKK